MKKPVLFIFLVFTTLLSASIQLFSQTQSLWSRVRTEKFEEVGLSALQYLSPLWGQQNSFFDIEKTRGNNEWISPDNSWLTRDFNNDGFSDIFISFISSEKESVPFILLIYNKETGKYNNQSFRLKNNIGQPFCRKTVTADFNGDGFLDMAMVSHPECQTCNYSYFDILISNSSDTTWTQNRIREADRSKDEGYYHGIAVGDLDNDGDIDIVLAEENKIGTYSLINDGKAHFQEMLAIPNDRGSDFVRKAYTVELADINQDKYLDLLYWHDQFNARIMYGDGTGTFGKKHQELAPREYPLIMDYDIRDIDQDGDYDLVMTTNNNSNWQLVFWENKGIDSAGKIIWADNTKTITNSLKSQGFYVDEHTKNWEAYIQIIDINGDGVLDIIPQRPLNNLDTWNQWILLGDSTKNWNYVYRKIPFVESPVDISASNKNGKILLNWKSKKQWYSPSDGGVKNWGIYTSNKTFGDRCQVSSPIVVPSKNLQIVNGYNQLQINQLGNETFVRISVFDSLGIESPLSDLVKIENTAPIANAGNDQSVNEGTTVTLDGSFSSDPDGTPLSYKWTVPNGISLSSTSEPKPTFKAPEIKKDSTLIFSLIVNDGFIDSSPSLVRINIKNVIKVGVNDVSKSLLMVSPNPTTGVITIKGLTTTQKNGIVIQSIDGKLIQKKSTNSETETIDISDQRSGVYLLFINGQPFKILKE